MCVFVCVCGCVWMDVSVRVGGCVCGCVGERVSGGVGMGGERRLKWMGGGGQISPKQDCQAYSYCPKDFFVVFIIKFKSKTNFMPIM